MADGITFLQSVQQADGSFASFSSPVRQPFRATVTYQTTFGPAIMLAALNQVDHRSAKPIKRNLANWLLAQRSPHWSFNYWAVQAPQRNTLPYPDDLDDTFCALIALHGYDATLIDHDCLGRMTRLLIATESRVGGPYRTWLAANDAPKIWHDVDVAVNSNIACFLQAVASPLPNLTDMMSRAIQTQTFTSPYYPSAYPIIYYLARACADSDRAALATYIRQLQQGGWWQTPLQTALMISALKHLGQHVPVNAIDTLAEAQLPDGSWPAEAFCLDPALKKRNHYSGSAALTTALALEALAISTTHPTSKSAPATRNRPFDTLQATIATTARQQLAVLQPELRRASWRTLDQTIQHDTEREITLLPAYFNHSLQQPLAPDNTCLLTLGLANLYGWMAYTIYDDFLDDEGKPELLPVANTALRYSLRAFQDAVPDAAFQALVTQTFDIIDSANAWELAHCRLPVTGKSLVLAKLPRYPGGLQLSERSQGHTLTPLGVLTTAGIQPNDPRALALKQALQHYIVARQLHDDMHDWEKDVQAGQATYVVTAILRELQLPPGTHTFSKLLPAMQRQFWHHTIATICDVVLHHTKLARQKATRSQLLQPDNIISTLADKIEATARATLEEQSGAQKFLAAYQNK